MSVLYLSHHQLISVAVSLFVSVPISATNGIFFYWILAALERTLGVLKEENQQIKFQIMRRFIIALYFSIALGVISTVALIVLRVKTDRDDMWEYEWLYQTIFFSIFTFFLFWVMTIMRPTYRSRMLASIQ
jgi:hypothetical protein